MAEENVERELALLSIQQNIFISNFMVHEACISYNSIYHDKWMPLSFVEFFFEQYKLYGQNKSAYLKEFFNEYSTADLPDIIENYSDKVYSLITNKTNKFEELSYKLGNFAIGLNIDLTDPSYSGRQTSDMAKELLLVKKSLDGADENVSFEELYEKYMIRKIVLLRERTKQVRQQTNEKEEPLPQTSGAKIERAFPAKTAVVEAQQQTNNNFNQRLVGAATVVPDQKGKITKLFFPRLALPSPYPIPKDKSRINSEHRVRRLMSADREIKLIDGKKFNTVKYTTGFLEKRRIAAKPVKRKFDFDF